jgi:hypothetical protein
LRGFPTKKAWATTSCGLDATLKGHPIWNMGSTKGSQKVQVSLLRIYCVKKCKIEVKAFTIARVNQHGSEHSWNLYEVL